MAHQSYCFSSKSASLIFKPRDCIWLLLIAQSFQEPKKWVQEYLKPIPMVGYRSLSCSHSARETRIFFVFFRLKLEKAFQAFQMVLFFWVKAGLVPQGITWTSIPGLAYHQPCPRTPSPSTIEKNEILHPTSGLLMESSTSPKKFKKDKLNNIVLTSLIDYILLPHSFKNEKYLDPMECMLPCPVFLLGALACVGVLSLIHI